MPAYEHLLTLVVLLPFGGALLAASFPRGEHTGVRALGLVVMLATLALTLVGYSHFDASSSMLQLREEMMWLPTLGARWALGVDGVSLPLVLLTALMSPVALLCSYGRIYERTREYIVCLLALEGAVLGALCAVDLFAFYIFWEGMLIPSFFLIGMWGGHGRREAALRFFLMTMAGSMLMLVALIALGYATRTGDGVSFLWTDLVSRLHVRSLGIGEFVLFLAFALAFLIKLPLVPLHGWLADAYAEAPAATVVMLSAVMVKVGALGFLRYALVLFPRAATVALPLIASLCVVGVLLGAWLAYGQHSLRRALAYSSLSHMGMIGLGLCAMSPVSLTGSVVQMVNHGISTGALFVLAALIAERNQGESFRELGGLAQRFGHLSWVFMLMALSSMALPGLNGFVGEFLILLGTYSSRGVALSVREGYLVQGALLLGLLVTIAAMVTLAWRLLLAQPKEGLKGALARIVAFMCATGAVGLLLSPPTGAWPGGLLMAPLVTRSLSAQPYLALFPTLAVVATLGVVLTAAYMLKLVGATLFGLPRAQLGAASRHHDLNAREWTMLLPLVALAVALGVHPAPLLTMVEPTARAYAEQFRTMAGWAEAEALIESRTSEESK